MSFDQISLQLPCSRIIKYILVCNTGFLLSSHVLCKGSTDFLFSVKPFSILTFALVKEPAHANESELAKLVVEIVLEYPSLKTPLYLSFVGWLSLLNLRARRVGFTIQFSHAGVTNYKF
jgi:hypothetical protein